MSRGGREGNNALVKDVARQSFEYNSPDDATNLAKRVMEWDCPVAMINELVLGRDPILPLYQVRKKITGIEEWTWLTYYCLQIVNAIIHGVRSGNVEAATNFIQRDLKTNTMGSSFNHFHHEALTRSGPKVLIVLKQVQCIIL